MAWLTQWACMGRGMCPFLQYRVLKGRPDCPTQAGNAWAKLMTEGSPVPHRSHFPLCGWNTPVWCSQTPLRTHRWNEGRIVFSLSPLQSTHSLAYTFHTSLTHTGVLSRVLIISGDLKHAGVRQGPICAPSRVAHQGPAETNFSSVPIIQSRMIEPAMTCWFP